MKKLAFVKLLVSLTFATHGDKDLCFTPNGPFYIDPGSVTTITPFTVSTTVSSCIHSEVTLGCVLLASDCSSAFTSDSTVGVTQNSNFGTTSSLTIDTTSVGAGYSYMTACVKCTYYGRGRDGNYDYNNVFSVNICKASVTLSSSASYFAQYTFSRNIGDQLNTAIHSAMTFPGYCTQISQKIYTESGGVFTEYSGSDIRSDGTYNIYISTTTPRSIDYYIAGFSHSSTLQDFKKIRVIVCGTETLTAVGDQSLVVQSAGTYTGEAIPWTTVQNYITFSAGSDSSSSCRSQTLSNLKLYTNSEMTSLWTGTTQVQLVESPSSEFKINIYNDQTFDSELVLYYGETTLGSVKASVKLSITVCGQETLKTLGTHNQLFQAVNSYSSAAIEHTDLASWFTFTGFSGCRSYDLAHVKLYQDAAMTTEYTDTTLVELEINLSNEIRLKVYNDQAWTSILTVYVGETTIGGAKESKKVKIQVCGKETLTADSSDVYDVTLQKVPNYTNAGLLWSIVQNFISFSAGSSSSTSCRSQDMDHLKLYTDSALTSTWTGTSQVALIEDPTSQFQIKIFNDQPFPSQLTLYYGETTLGNIKASKTVRIKVCGGETLTPSTGSFYKLFQAVNTYVNAAIEYVDLSTFIVFDPTVNACPECRSYDLAHVKLYQDAAMTTEYTDTTLVELEINLSNEIRLKVYNDQAWTSILIVYLGETTIGGVKASKEIQIQVCGKETLTADSTKELDVTFPLVSTYAGANITWANISQYLIFDAGTHSSLSCRSLDLTHLKLYSDSDLTTIWTGTTVINLVLDPINSSQFQINVYNNQPLDETIVYYQETTLGLINSFKIINILVCGNELVSTSVSSRLTFSFYKGPITQTIPTIVDYFSSNQTRCPVHSYVMLGENKQPYTENIFQFDDDYSILVDTIGLVDRYYLTIVGSTEFGSSPGSIELSISVIERDQRSPVSSPPMFNGSVEGYSETIDFNDEKVQKEYESDEYKSFQIDLPEIFDFDGDMCSISFASPTLGFEYWTNTTNGVKLGALKKKSRKPEAQIPYVNMIYNENGNFLVIQIQKDQVNNFQGLNTIQIILQDEKQNEMDSDSIVFFLTVVEKNQVIEPVEIIQEEEEGEFICRAKIESINQFGDVLILFNVDMKTEFVNITHLNDTIIDMYIEPYNMWSSWTQDFNLTTLNFTWNVTSYIGKELNIKLYFYNPEVISPKEVYDNLVFHIKEKGSNFIAERELVDIHDYYTTLRHKVKRQMADTKATRSLDKGASHTETALMFSLVFTMTLGLWLTGALSLLVGFINAMQLIVHLPIFNVAFPANVMTFFRYLIPIVMFDIMQHLDVITGIFKPNQEEVEVEEEEEVLAIYDQIIDLGYDSHKPYNLLGTLGVLTILYFVKLLLFYLIIRPLAKHFKKVNDLKVKMEEQLFYSEILILLIEGYLEFSITFFLKQDKPVHDDQDLSENIQAYFMASLSFIVLPFVFFWFLFQDLAIINSDPFKQKWEALFEGLKTKEKPQLFYYFVFVVRRLIYVISSFVLVDHSYFQCITLNYLNLGVTIYLGYTMSLKSRYSNRIDLMNELFVTMASMNVMLFTDFVTDPSSRYYYGWWFITIMVTQMTINFLIVAQETVRLLGLVVKKVKNRCPQITCPWKERVRQYLSRNDVRDEIEEAKEEEKENPEPLITHKDNSEPPEAAISPIEMAEILKKGYVLDEGPPQEQQAEEVKEYQKNEFEKLLESNSKKGIQFQPNRQGFDMSFAEQKDQAEIILDQELAENHPNEFLDELENHPQYSNFVPVQAFQAPQTQTMSIRENYDPDQYQPQPKAKAKGKGKKTKVITSKGKKINYGDTKTNAYGKDFSQLYKD